MVAALKKFYRAIALHGIAGALRNVLAYIAKRSLWFFPKARRERAFRKEREANFDLQWGSDTGGIFVPDEATVVGQHWRYGGRYQGCNPNALVRALNGLSVDFRAFQFVDLGCGKGRALLVAARFPFRKVVGVEYSPDLCQIARNNLATFPSNERRCDDFEVFCGDASEYQFPSGPLVIFLFNPFGEKVMQHVASNALEAHRRFSQRIIVIYSTPDLADVWSDTGIMFEVSRSQSMAIFDTQPRNPN